MDKPRSKVTFKYFLGTHRITIYVSLYHISVSISCTICSLWEIGSKRDYAIIGDFFCR